MENTKKNFPDVTVGIVGHIAIDNLSDVKKVLEELPYFDIVFFRTSSGKLWIMEGDALDGRE